jgi:signal transduction histidine kinase
MEQTVRQLMDFGRSNPLNRAPLDVKALLQRLAEDAAPEDERVAIEIQCADGLPTVRVDALRTEQAVRNLLSNAVHAAHSRVRVAATSDARGLRIEVGDDGPGVPGADRNKIFDPFYTTKPVGQGTGLGLSVAAAVADDHGGHLTVEDDALGGARFVLLLPQEDRDAHAA